MDCLLFRYAKTNKESSRRKSRTMILININQRKIQLIQCKRAPFPYIFSNQCQTHSGDKWSLAMNSRSIHTTNFTFNSVLFALDK